MLIRRFAFLLRPGGKIEVARGIRTLMAMAIPSLLGLVLQEQQDWLTIALFAQIMLLADVGGLYAQRAKTLIGTTVGVFLALFLGTLVSGSLGWTLLLVSIGLFLAGYLTVYGENGGASGVVLGFTLLLAISLPQGGFDTALMRSLLGLMGGLWSIFLALFIWPFQPNYPLRKVVAQNFQGIAQHLQRVSTVKLDREQNDQSFVQVRQLLLKSRETLTYTRLGSWGHNDLRELLIVLIEDSDRIMTTLTAMREIVTLHSLPQLATVEILLEDVLKQVALICEDIAQLILGKQKKPDCDRLQLLIKALQQQQQLQQQTLTLDVDDYTSWITVEQLNTWLEKLQSQLQLTVQTTQELQRGDNHKHPLQNREKIAQILSRHKSEIKALGISSKQQWWEPLKENFTLESPLFRHALRLSIGAVLGVLIYTLLPIRQGFWIGLTLLFVLKPDFSLTFQRFFSRILGTVLGVGAVYGILVTVQDPLWLEIIGIIAMAIAISLIRFHYSLAVFFITAFALILHQISGQTSENLGITDRIVCTLIGGILAFALSFGLLRQKEEWRFSTVAITALNKVNLYFQAVMTAFLDKTVYQVEELHQRRNKARIANTYLQTALERLIDDPSTPFVKIEPAITLANYIPRLGRGVTILLTQLEQYSGSEAHPNINLFIQQVTEALTMLSEALQNNQKPLPLPALNKTVQDIFSHLQALQQARLSEISNHQDSQQLRPYLQDYNIVITELREIVRRIEAIQAAIARFEGDS